MARTARQRRSRAEVERLYQEFKKEHAKTGIPATKWAVEHEIHPSFIYVRNKRDRREYGTVQPDALDVDLVHVGKNPPFILFKYGGKLWGARPID